MTAFPEPAPLAAAFEADFIRLGYHNLGQAADPALCRGVLRRVLETRRLDASLFMEEAAFDADPVYTGVNPRPGRNIAERFDAETRAILAAPGVDAHMRTMLGPDYGILDCKFVCGIPVSVIPEWIRTRISGNGVNNLGAYVREDFRDITYFYGIDYHQDLIDWADRPTDFITLYVYLDTVGETDAPIYLLEGSHSLGGTVFPHDLQPMDATREHWRYGDGTGQATSVRQLKITGEAGNVAYWHACTLHGTQPSSNDRPRVSLRYLLTRDPKAETCALDRINAAIDGPLSATRTRVDLDAQGAARLKKNHLLTLANAG